MIVCDGDNITERSARPSQEAIQEERRKQIEALMDLRRRLGRAVRPRAVASVPPSA